MEKTATSLHTKIEQMLTEARVILPGVQALLGFQFVVMLTKAFDQLPPAARIAHLVALLSLVLAIILLIAPAAIHRITFDGNDDPRLHSTGSVLIAMALLPLALADDPSPQLLAYAATKGAITNFTSGLAQMLAPEGIRVNAVAPGPIWTPLIPSTMPAEKPHWTRFWLVAEREVEMNQSYDGV